MNAEDNAVKTAGTELLNMKNDDEHLNVVENGDGTAVSVIVRVRPLSTVEHANPSVTNIVQCLKDGVIIHYVPPYPSSRFFGVRHLRPRPQHFKVDKVFQPYSTQIEVYAECREIVTGVFEGINGSILAYGATGTGKTHTMFGGSMSPAGVIYQAMQDILEKKEQLESEGRNVVTVLCTFLEVYNDEVFDLLATSNSCGKRGPLKVQEFGSDDYSIGIRNKVNADSLVVKGLTAVAPKNAKDFTKLIELGQKNRFVASTHANAESSRSHSILTVEVEVKSIVNRSVSGTIGRIRFCDLAGSERAAGTRNSGIRLQEGGSINRSLLALGGVVQALKQRRKNTKNLNYIPYRGSKLTRLLRDCLTVNCRTLLLFCISPSSMNYEETINTMLFAMQAKEIRFWTKRHDFSIDFKKVEKSQEALINELCLELAQTRDELLRLKGCSSLSCDVSRSQVSFQNSQPVGSSAVSLSTGSTRNKSDATSALCGVTPTTFGDGQGELFEGLFDSSLEPNCSALPQVLSVTGDLEAYAMIKNKLTTLSVNKERLYREMQEAQKSRSELDIRLRQHKWKLARFFSTRRTSLPFDARAGRAASVGVAGLQRAIKDMEAESVAQGGEMKRLLIKMNATDHNIAKICQNLQRKKQQPFIELLLENVKLRQSSTEAECLAAQYHQECRCFKNREEEYVQALGMCTSAIKSLLPLAPNFSVSKKEAQLALALARIPSLSTGDMMLAFDRSMNNDSQKSGQTCEFCRFVASAEGKKGAPEYQAKEPKSGSKHSDFLNNVTDNANVSGSGSSNGNVARPAQQHRLLPRRNMASGAGKVHDRSFCKTKSAIVLGANATHLEKMSLADPIVQKRPQKRLIRASATEKTVVTNKQLSSSNGVTSGLLVGPKKRLRPTVSASSSQSCNGVGAARVKTVSAKNMRTAAVASVGASGSIQVENVPPQRRRSCSRGAKPAARGKNHECLMRLRRTQTVSVVCSGGKD